MVVRQIKNINNTIPNYLRYLLPMMEFKKSERKEQPASLMEFEAAEG